MERLVVTSGWANLAPVVAVLRDLIEDMAGKSLSGMAYAIHGDVVRETVRKITASGAGP